MPSNIKSIWGSNDDVNWTKITTAPTREEATSNVAGLAFGYDDRLEFKNLDNPNYYKYHAIVADAFTQLKDVKLFGVRKQGSSTLHDGALTLTNGISCTNLAVPRIGPPLDADDTPRRDRLVVEYNTSTNPTFEGAVRDTSGRGNDGIINSSVTYDSTSKEFDFAGDNDWIESPALGWTGAQPHSVSVWIKLDVMSNPNSTSIQNAWTIRKPNSTDATSRISELHIFSNGTIEWAWHSNNNTTAVNKISSGQYYHIVCVYNGGAGNVASSRRMWINGVEETFATVSSTASAINFYDTATFAAGYDQGLDNYDLNGKMSSIKLYDTALTASEVKTLYDMGRCDEGHHTATVSRSQLRMGGENLVIEPCIKGFYEEGTWEPIMGGQSGGQKTPTSSNSGWFVRIGNLVTIGGTLAWNGGGTISGNPILAGLPYKATSYAGGRCVLGWGVSPSGFTTPSGNTTMRMIIDPNLQYAYILATDDQNAVGYTHSVTIGASGLLYGLGGTYKI
jgi:hypothetical protein